MDNDGLILLGAFRFPQHWQIQEWLSQTEYGDQFDLTLVEVRMPAWNGSPGTTSVTTPALEPKTDGEKFLWKLKGPEALAETAKELEQKILDFHKK